MRSRSADFILRTTNSCKAEQFCKIHSSEVSKAHSSTKSMLSMFSEVPARKYELLTSRTDVTGFFLMKIIITHQH